MFWLSKHLDMEIEQDVAHKKATIDKGYKDFQKQQGNLAKTVKDYYIKSYYNSPLVLLLSASSASEVTQQLGYQKVLTDKDKETLTNMALTIQDLETKKANLEDEEKRLAIAKASLDEQSGKLDKVVAGAKTYQAQLSGQIAELSAKQQSILAAKSGSFTFSIGEGELADELLSSIKGFREQAPSGYFAIFSFGGYTHRKGMSQYGARGRAAAGQDFKTILKAYYGKEPVGKDTNGPIKVSGFGEIDFETTYLYGIAEMPSSWPAEALKAQAVAARTYAYRSKVAGNEICTTESCQVFNKGKSDNPPQAWKDAVDQTKGQVLEDVVTYFASTHGGFASPIGWDTKSGGGGSNFIDDSWEKAGASPWLYKAWWREGYSNSSNTCGRSNPWLSPEELADIVNAAIALKNSGGIETGRITPVTTGCWGGNPYGMDELRNITSGKGGISSATSVSVSQGNGTTNSVTINGVTLSGEEFKKAVALRAPGYIRIPQSGFAFFNIEKK
jgi:SpoIID/LytB domain protein